MPGPCCSPAAQFASSDAQLAVTSGQTPRAAHRQRAGNDAELGANQRPTDDEGDLNNAAQLIANQTLATAPQCQQIALQVILVSISDDEDSLSQALTRK